MFLAKVIWDVALACSIIVLILAAKRDYLMREVKDIYPISLLIMFLLGKVFCAITIFFDESFTSSLQTFATSESVIPILRSAVIFFMLLLFTVILERLRKREMFGGADIKVLAASSLFINTDQFLVALLIACATLIVIAITKKNTCSLTATFPFVVYYCVGYSFVVIWQVATEFI